MVKSFFNLAPDVSIRTQKARGLWYLSHCGSGALPVLGLIQSREDCCGDAVKFPYFARPCPVTPQHGFVESRIVTNETDLLALWDEMVAVDPNGEILLTPVYDNVKLNAIWTPTTLTIGPGHDGATSGKGSFTIPLVRSAVSGAGAPLSSHLLSLAGITDDPYVEVIYPAAAKSTILTQLRNGPRLDVIGPDYIPAALTVTHIIQPQGEDLLQWQARLAALSAEEKAGLVIWHPGGALTDHYAIHARQHGIALFTSVCPAIGDTIAPMTTAEPDLAALRDGLIVGQELPIAGSTQHAVGLILLGLHHAAAMTGPAAFWTGLSAALMARLGTTAALGEVRHLKPESRRPPREAVYALSLKRHPLSWHRVRIGRAYNGLRYGRFASSSVGGAPWAACAKTTIDLFDAIGEVVADPTPTTYATLLGALNMTITQAHHNGWWMNKFVGAGSNLYTAIAQTDCLALIPLAPLAATAHTLRHAITAKDRRAFAAQVASWPRGVPLPPKPLAPTLEWSTTAGLPVLSVRSRELKTARTIPIPLNDIGSRLVHHIRHSLTIHRTPNGYECRIANPGKPPTILWRESPIVPKLKVMKA